MHDSMTSFLPALKSGQVHVWHADSMAVDPRFLPQLSAEETSRLNRIGASGARSQFIGGRALLRGVLGHYLDREPASLEFAVGAHGKPALAEASEASGASGLEFNLSHSGNDIVIAVAWHSAVGVDIEAWRNLERLDALAQRCLAPREYAEIAGQSRNAMNRGFFRFWVRKEALGKASGRGIALGLQDCISSLLGTPRWLEIPPELGNGSEWSLAELPSPGGYSSAVTARVPEACFCYGRIEFEKACLVFEKLKSLRYSKPDCVLGNAAVDSAWYPSR